MSLAAKLLASSGLGTKTPGPEFISTVSDTADKSSYTFSNVSLGTPGSKRIILIIVGMASNTGVTNAISQVTLNGVATTTAVKRDNVARLQSGIFVIAESASFVGDIVVTLSTANARRCIVSVVTLYGYSSFSVFNAATLGQASGNNLSVNIATPAVPSILLSATQKDAGYGIFVAGIATTAYTAPSIEGVGYTLGWTFLPPVSSTITVSSSWTSSLSSQLIGAALGLIA
jgi:hypothetical protein